MSEIARLLPEDEHNRRLIDNVHPSSWIPPEPAAIYNLVVVGAGTAGLVSALGAASLGARVALVEKQLMGGDCLNTGCVPSKALIRSARVCAEIRDASAFGIGARDGAQVNFAKVMERMRRVRADISPHDSAARAKSLGVDVYLGEGRFVAPDALEVDGHRLRFRRAVIATGARAAAPPISGLYEAGFLTNETIFSLTELPKRLAVLGAGPIGSEMAQSFARFGSEVSLIEREAHILPREDSDAAARVQEAFRNDGVRIYLGATLERVTSDENGKHLWLTGASGTEEITVDEILVGLGRAPNANNLGLENAGVTYDERSGVLVDDHLALPRGPFGTTALSDFNPG